jgi:hypothetical protein
MKRYWLLLSCLALWANAECQERPRKVEQSAIALPSIMTVTLDPLSITVLHLRLGYVSSVRMPEEISSVVVGDPNNFKTEHSESEPRMVFVKPVSTHSTETNLLITTVSGRSVSLHLINDVKAASEQRIDFVLNYEPAHTLLIQPTSSTFLISDAEARTTSSDPPPANTDYAADELRHQSGLAKPLWQGKEPLKVAVGRLTGGPEQQMTLAFSVLNKSSNVVELLPPEVVLMGPNATDHKRKTRAEPLPLSDFRLLPSRRLPPGGRADGVIVFARPGFKESAEGVFLQIAQADQVDHPVQVPIPFTPTDEANAR